MVLSYKEFLLGSGYSYKTMQEYLYYEKKLVGKYLSGDNELDKDSIWRFYTHNKSNGVCRAFLKSYIQDYLGHEEVKIPLKKGRKKKKETQYMSKEEVYSFVKKLKIELGLAVLFAFEGGMRLKELCSIEWRDINFDDRIIKIHHGKGGKFREVRFSEFTLKVLDRWLEGNDRNRTKVFETKYKQFQAEIQKYGLEYLNKRTHFHMFRHSCGFWLANDLDMPLDEVAMYLGHTNINTTQIYAHKDKQRVLSKVGENL